MTNNPYLDQFLMFYSQARVGNGQTRGLETEISRKTYVETRLDRELATGILKGQFRLVILTGNAGDGKTAFIQKVEEEAKRQGATLVRTGFGNKFELGKVSFKTLHDGSVELSDASNLQMLDSYFRDYAGDTPPSGTQCLVAAMNEGKLRDYLHAAAEHPWLSGVLLDHLDLDSPLPDDVALVNLNLRAVVDGSADPTDCLFDRILDRFLAAEFWGPCEQCPSRHSCPVKFNVDSMRIIPPAPGSGHLDESTKNRNASAQQVRSRLKRLFQVLHLRKRMHMTVRDLRSVLAFTLFGTRTCAEIGQAIQEGSHRFNAAFYYNAVFNEDEKDRVLRVMREFDVGLVQSPHLDSQLNFTAPKTSDFHALFVSFEDQVSGSRSPVDEDDLDAQFQERPNSPEQRTFSALNASRSYVRQARRKYYFEGRGDAGANRPDELLPYHHLADYLSFVETGLDPEGRLKNSLILAISKSEGMIDDRRGAEHICIRTRHDNNLPVKAFYTYPASHFRLDRLSHPYESRFIEHLPSEILLVHDSRKISLEISLDLFELLMRIRDGYMPTTGEMRAFFLNLLMFKKQLLSAPTDRLLLTENDDQVFEVKRTPANGIEMAAV
jgi:hypothetical protein|tara:strand:- start:210 stop:2033 length:1824 start_codon:yes stop_codon:yes gene_type:complete